MPSRRTVKPGKPPEPIELQVEMVGVGSVKLWGCPVCGRNGQDKTQIAAHLKTHGGEG
jgi:hypothetical protein